MKTSFALASSILAATTYAQVTVNGSSNVTCPVPGDYCVGGPYIAHCNGPSGYIGNCWDNLDNPDATCIQTNSTSADGACCVPGQNCPGDVVADSTTTTVTTTSTPVTTTTSTALVTSSSIDYFFNTSSFAVILVPVTPVPSSSLVNSSSVLLVTSSSIPYPVSNVTTTTTSAAAGPTGISISTPSTPTLPIGSSAAPTLESSTLATSTPRETSTLSTSTLLDTSTLATSTIATSALVTSPIAAGSGSSDIGTSAITGTVTSTATIGGSGSGSDSGSGSTTTDTAVVTASQISDGQIQATSAGAAPTTSTVAPYAGSAASVKTGGLVGAVAVVLGALLV